MGNVATAGMGLQGIRPRLIPAANSTTFAERFRFKLCSKMLIYVSKKCPELLVNFIMEKANEVAVGVTMAVLDRERIGHCKYCPERFSLKKVGLDYVCPHHASKEK